MAGVSREQLRKLLAHERPELERSELEHKRGAGAPDAVGKPSRPQSRLPIARALQPRAGRADPPRPRLISLSSRASTGVVMDPLTDFLTGYVVPAGGAWQAIQA
jgi:hypothetical protein